MSVVLVVLAIKVLVSLYGLSCHLIRPSKVWFTLDFFQQLMHWFSEYSPDVLRVGCLRLPCKISPRAIIGISVRPEIPSLLRDNLLISFTLQLFFLHSLVLIDPIYQLAHTGGRLPVRDFLKPCSAGRLLLKVLMVTSSKLPSISLYISQYLSK